MGAPPRIGQSFVKSPASTGLDSATEELLHTPQAEVVGTVDPEKVARMLQAVPPPPWETDPTYAKHESDARRFVEAPDNVTLRWLNPKLVSQTGLRDWQAVPAKGDTRFKLRLRSLAAPDNTVRRGDDNGDFLAWMWTAWVESRTKVKLATAAKKTQGAVDRSSAFTEAARSGKFGPYVTSEAGRHPTHTIADGRTLERD